MKKSNMDIKIDQKYIWHPYHSILKPSSVFLVEKTKGCSIYLSDGRILLDGMASWWCVIHGYNHPKLLKAMKDQIEKMPHVMFGGLTHAPAIQLTKNLIEILPKELTKFFFCDSGSVAVEVAMKMSIQYWMGHKKINKTKIMSLKGGYHGDTLMAMSVCDPVNGMHDWFQNALPKQVFLPRPPKDLESFDQYQKIISKIFEQHASFCSALIVEPLLQGAGGMHLYPCLYLKLFKQMCEKYDVLLIFDEIATGFGRLGDWFASKISAITPDIICIGKALTGGCMSLAATIATEQVAKGVESKGRILMHGPTFMANPLSCAVANASIELLKEYDWQSKVHAIESMLQTLLTDFLEYPNVVDIRVKGALGVIELDQAINLNFLQPFFVEQGVWIRPFNRLIYIMPPFVITKDQLVYLVQSMKKSVEKLLTQSNELSRF